MPALRDLAIALAAALALAAWDLSGGDLALVRWFGSAQGFAWRDHWFTSVLMHDRARTAGVALLVLLALNVWRPLPFARALTRTERLRWFATTLGCALLVPLLKQASATSCPWSLAEFGGAVARYVPHWALGQRDGGAGGCFPSGHASVGFSFIAGWFALRERAPVAARAWLAATLLAGLALGWVQVMRGAHYPSHPLWTGWICWTAAAAAYRPLLRRSAQPDHARIAA